MKKQLKDFLFINIGKEGQVTFGLNDLGEEVRGIDLLTQTIIKRILTLPGSDLYFPSIGSQLGGLFGASTKEDINDAKAMLPIMLKNLEADIITEQEEFEELSDDERLLAIELSSIDYDENLLGWILKLKIWTHANNFINITL